MGSSTKKQERPRRGPPDHLEDEPNEAQQVPRAALQPGAVQDHRVGGIDPPEEFPV